MKVDWLIESLRFTIFYGGEDSDPAPLWKRVTGEDPEEVRSQPKRKSLVEEGRWIDGKLTTGMANERLDVVYVGEQKEDDPGYASVGDFNTAIKHFRQAIGVVTSIERPVRRIAFGAAFFRPTPDREQGYRELNELLHDVTLDPEGSRDFLYRINRPRTVNIADAAVIINRLSTWAASVRKSLRLEQSGDMEVVKTSDPQVAVRVEVDVNTDPTAGPFDRPQVEAIADRLIEFGKEISERGDVK
jgi:hypothetical protein